LFPKTLSKERKEYISKLLPVNKKQEINYDDYEVKILDKYDDKYDNLFNETEETNENEQEPNIGCATQ
jgi:hypothetical protein